MKLRKTLLATAMAIPFALTTSQVALADYSKHPKAQEVILELAKSEEFTVDELMAVFKSAAKQDRILSLMSKPAEKVKPWYEYRNIFISDRRVNQGVQFWNENADALKAASEKTGVPAKMIVAIIGVETSYGRITGSHRVIDALSTLAFEYPRRSEFFTKELKAYLKLTKEQGVDPLSLKGSYAGAMGYGQFMPSSYQAYAVDGDGDGKIDIWNNPTDAIHSVANYFKQHKWQAGESVMAGVTLFDDADESMVDNTVKPSADLFAWARIGFEGQGPEPGDTKAALLRYDQKDGPEYKFGFHNFYVITRYNRSRMYARAAWELANLIEEKHTP